MGPAYVIGTHDTKGAELRHVADLLRAAGLAVVSVDVSTSGAPSSADVTPAQIAGDLATDPPAGSRCSTCPVPPFHDPEADAALLAALDGTAVVRKVPAALNDPEFADAVVAAWREVCA